MKNLLLDLIRWQGRLEREPLAVFLDYDGTLSAIAPTPAQAKLSAATQEVLRSLVKLKNVKVAIISGRALSDLRKRVLVKGLSYVGSHGIEFQSGGAVSKCIPVRYLRELRELKKKLTDELKDLPGILLEQKPFSLAIHYRKASLRSEKIVKKAILSICGHPVHKGRILIMFGKKVIEIMPITTMNKGQAVEHLLRTWGRKRFLPIFIGDDTTDETAFDVVRGRGLTVRVGAPQGRSKAEYSLNGVADVRALLEMIISFRASY